MSHGEGISRPLAV